jgi:hypothetical protein
MSLRVCPIAHVHAPVSQVWSFLLQPENYARWWDAQTRGIKPEGASHAGQRIHAHMVRMGIPFNVDILVESVDEAHRTLDVMTTLPLGIILFNHIACKELDALSSQVSFGSDFSFSPVWWGWLLERYASQQLYARVAALVLRLKQAAEAAA